MIPGGRRDGPRVWPRQGGLLERLGLAGAEIEERSRAAAAQAVGDRWAPDEAALAAAIVYAAGDAALAALVELRGRPLAAATAALSQGGRIVADVAMVRAGARAGRDRMLVGVEMEGAGELADRAGVTRSAAGMRLAWDRLDRPPLVVIGNAPTALLAVLDLAAELAPACVIATCPGFQVASEAKSELATSGIPHVLVAGSQGGSGLAVAALNHVLAQVPASMAVGPPSGARGGD